MIANSSQTNSARTLRANLSIAEDCDNVGDARLVECEEGIYSRSMTVDREVV